MSALRSADPAVEGLLLRYGLEPEGQNAAAGALSPDARRRVGDLLRGMDDTVTPELGRLRRVIKLLEWTGTPEARRQLERLAGLPLNRGGWDATAALDRLDTGKTKAELASLPPAAGACGRVPRLAAPGDRARPAPRFAARAAAGPPPSRPSRRSPRPSSRKSRTPRRPRPAPRSRRSDPRPHRPPVRSRRLRRRQSARRAGPGGRGGGHSPAAPGRARPVRHHRPAARRADPGIEFFGRRHPAGDGVGRPDRPRVGTPLGQGARPFSRQRRPPLRFALARRQAPRHRRPRDASASTHECFDETVAWDVDAHKVAWEYPLSRGEFTYAAVSPDGKTVVAGCDDQTLRVWDLSAGGEPTVLDPEHPAADGGKGAGNGARGSTRAPSSSAATGARWSRCTAPRTPRRLRR